VRIYFNILVLFNLPAIKK